MQATNDIPATAAETSAIMMDSSGPALSTVLWVVAIVTSCAMVLVMLGFMLCVVIRLYRLEELLSRAKLGARILAHRASEQTTEALSAAKNVAARITASSSNSSSSGKVAAERSKQYHRRTTEPHHPSYYVEEEPQIVYDFAGGVEPSQTPDTEPLPVQYVSDIEAPPPPPPSSPSNLSMQQQQRNTLQESAKAMDQLMPIAEQHRPVYQRGVESEGDGGGISRRNGHNHQRPHNPPRHRYPPQPRGVRGIKVGPGYGSRPRGGGGSIFVPTSLRSKSAPPPTQKLSGLGAGNDASSAPSSRSSFEEIPLSSAVKKESEGKGRRDL